jgi:hypothetical protein
MSGQSKKQPSASGAEPLTPMPALTEQALRVAVGARAADGYRREH